MDSANACCCTFNFGVIGLGNLVLETLTRCICKHNTALDRLSDRQ